MGISIAAILILKSRFLETVAPERFCRGSSGSQRRMISQLPAERHYPRQKRSGMLEMERPGFKMRIAGG